HSQLSAIAIAERNRPLPLSLTQQRMWFLTRMDGASEAYHIGGAVQLNGTLDVPLLKRALERIVERHETLRTRYALIDEHPVQIIDAPGPIALDEHDLSAHADAEERFEALSEAHNQTPFDLEHGGPLRALLVRMAPDEHRLQVTLHHIAGDGWSVSLLLSELSALYSAYRQGEADPLPELAIQYADYAQWQR
ncbi:condensation domain-containing protein, partial [Denitromonas iodatirespirans]